jgi:hypothetical protein
MLILSLLLFMQFIQLYECILLLYKQLLRTNDEKFMRSEWILKYQFEIGLKFANFLISNSSPYDLYA